MTDDAPTTGRPDGGRPADGRSDGSRSDGGRSLAIHLVTRLLLLAPLVGVGYLTRPLWHGFVYGIVYSPSGALFGGGAILTALILWLLPPGAVGAETASSRTQLEAFQAADSPVALLFELEGTAGQKIRIFAGVLGVLGLLAVLVGAPAGVLEQRTLAETTTSEATPVETFPEANPDNPRVVPRRVADVTTRGSVSYRQYRLGTSDIARTENGSLAWSYPIQPDGFRNTLIERQQGVLITDMTRMDDRQIRTAEESFVRGEGMILWRSADWLLKSTDYFARYDDDAVEFVHDGRPYMYYPKTTHRWHFLPFPHTTPTWDGGALVHPDGTVDHLTPAAARENAILDGQRLYPLTLTRAEMESLGYRNGIINQLPVVGAHEGEVEVAGLPVGADNQQPFVIDLEGERLSYVTALEPYGEDTRGLDEVWFADAETGTYQFFSTGESTLTGPERAMGIARSADSRTNWGENFVVTEPVPVTIDGEFWWHLKVIPTDATDVTRSVFVNADTDRTVEIREDAAVRSFVRGTVTEGDLTPTADAGTDEPADAVYYVLVTDADGEVIERIPVEPGQEATIVSPDDERARGNQTNASG